MLCILKTEMTFKMHKIKFCPKIYVCLPYLRFQTQLPETLLFFIWSNTDIRYCTNSFKNKLAPRARVAIRPRGYKTFFLCSTQLSTSTKFQLLIKTKMPTNKEVSCFTTLRCCIYPANK